MYIFYGTYGRMENDRRITRHYSNVIMGAMASQITNLTIVYSTVYSSTDQRKHQSSASLAFVRGIRRWPVNSPHKWPVTRKMFPLDDVSMERDVLSARLCGREYVADVSTQTMGAWQHRVLCKQMLWCSSSLFPNTLRWQERRNSSALAMELWFILLIHRFVLLSH